MPKAGISRLDARAARGAQQFFRLAARRDADVHSGAAAVEPQKRSDITDVIGYDEDGQSTLGWPQAAECFDPLRQTSYWWTNRCDGYPLYTHVHSGNFTGQLFTLLFDPAGAPVRAVMVSIRLCLNKQGSHEYRRISRAHKP